MTQGPYNPSSTPGPDDSGPSADSWPRRLRLPVENAWREVSKLAQTILDSFVLPSGGFAAAAFCWLVSALFLALSLPILAFIGLGGLVVVAGLECLALLAYAYPGALFLASLAGGVAPPVVVYWALHGALGIQGDWTSWGAYPLLMAGLYGSYYYWRFGRVIAATGEGALAFYRRSAPKASQVFVAPLAILSTLWAILRQGLRAARKIVRELFTLVKGVRSDPTSDHEASPPAPESNPAGPSEPERDETR